MSLCYNWEWSRDNDNEGFGINKRQVQSKKVAAKKPGQIQMKNTMNA